LASVLLVDVCRPGDGLPDLVAVLSDGSALVAPNNGSYFFPEALNTSFPQGNSVVTAFDADGDDTVDLLFGGTTSALHL
jgi:hypothetical protein